jgi:hypothetical protein
MNEQGLLRLLIDAYKLGRKHGLQASEQEQQQTGEWRKCKESAKERFKELTTL